MSKPCIWSEPALVPRSARANCSTRAISCYTSWASAEAARSTRPSSAALGKPSLSSCSRSTVSKPVSGDGVSRIFLRSRSGDEDEGTGIGHPIDDPPLMASLADDGLLWDARVTDTFQSCALSDPASTPLIRVAIASTTPRPGAPPRIAGRKALYSDTHGPRRPVRNPHPARRREPGLGSVLQPSHYGASRAAPPSTRFWVNLGPALGLRRVGDLWRKQCPGKRSTCAARLAWDDLGRAAPAGRGAAHLPTEEVTW